MYTKPYIVESADPAVPQIKFYITDSVMKAEPPGARIVCEAEQADSSRVRLNEAESSRQIADITIHIPFDAEVTRETCEVSAALYWSWWRAQQLSEGVEYCWHCGDGLEPRAVGRPHCEHCPPDGECDLEGCTEDGCAASTSPDADQKSSA